MSKLLDEVAAPALTEMGTRFLLDPETGSLVVPFETEVGARLLITFDADDDSGEAIIFATLAAVPPARAAAVALLLATYNSRFSYTVFSLSDGVARVDICVPVDRLVDPPGGVRAAYQRLTAVIEETQHVIERTARLRQRRPRVLRQVEQIVDALENGSGPERG
jgi:hypothetical protein